MITLITLVFASVIIGIVALVCSAGVSLVVSDLLVFALIVVLLVKLFRRKS